VPVERGGVLRIVGRLGLRKLGRLDERAPAQYVVLDP